MEIKAKTQQNLNSLRTVQNLLHSFVSHLRSREALQWDDGRVGSKTQQQPARLQVSSQSRPMQRRLAQCVNAINLYTRMERVGQKWAAWNLGSEMHIWTRPTE